MKTPQICIVSQRVEAGRGWTSRKDLFLLAFRDWPLRIIFHSPFSHKRLSLSFSHKRILRNRNQIHSFAYIKSFIHKTALWTYEIKVSLVYRNKKGLGQQNSVMVTMGRLFLEEKIQFEWKCSRCRHTIQCSRVNCFYSFWFFVICLLGETVSTFSFSQHSSPNFPIKSQFINKHFICNNERFCVKLNTRLW